MDERTWVVLEVAAVRNIWTAAEFGHFSRIFGGFLGRTAEDVIKVHKGRRGRSSL